MSAKIAPDRANYDFGKRFMTALFALRSHIITQSTVNYPPGLSPNQIKMLHLVFHKPGVSQTSAAERLGVTTASISTSVREMEARGLIERRPNPDDARVMLLHLAPLGEQLFEQIFDGFINTCADLLAVLPCDEQQDLTARLEAVLVANDIDLEGGKMNYSDKVRVTKENPNPLA